MDWREKVKLGRLGISIKMFVGKKPSSYSPSIMLIIGGTFLHDCHWLIKFGASKTNNLDRMIANFDQ